MGNEPLRPEHLDTLFTAGTRYRSAEGSAFPIGPGAIYPFEAGTLRMPTGQLVAAELNAQSQPMPFTATIPPGDYPVVLSTLDGTVVAARVPVADQPVAAWQPAVQPKGDRLQPGLDELLGFDSCGSIVCLYDGGSGIHEEYWSLGEDLESNFRDLLKRRCAAEFRQPKSSGNIIAFRSSIPDAFCPTWIGRAVDGRIACILIDMNVYGSCDLIIDENGSINESRPSPGTGSAPNSLPESSILTVVDRSDSTFRFDIDGGAVRASGVRARPQGIIEWAHRNGYTINARGRVADGNLW
ncbi:DUF4241 domain-containing protein [Nocardia fusca]|uniref:DUF4241 domain-containing protein n=1 Tax=Nocardia fusca TaxID=941183 RepID=A0ABV3FDG9_9NOCA